jgi:hypothetical protein
MRLMTGRQSIIVNSLEEIFRGDYLCIYLRVDGRSQLLESQVKSLLAQGVTRLIYANHDFELYRLIRRPGELSPVPSSLGTFALYRQLRGLLWPICRPTRVHA